MTIIGRSRFQKYFGSLVIGGMLAGTILGGCASGTLPTYRHTTPSSVIDLYLNWYPELYTTGGAIQLTVAGRVKPIVVIRLSIGTFAAVSSECTYDGCTVEKNENQFRCPCGGSRFTLDGTVMGGPAERSLESYRTEYKTGMVKIILP
jgi:nitrite reductase/ring-hydroxylating ferredoxin subunit